MQPELNAKVSGRLKKAIWYLGQRTAKNSI